MATTTPNTHADLSEIWTRAAKKATMFKDLPRLAKRITVIVEGWGPCVTLGNLASGLPSNKPITPGSHKPEGTWACPVCQQLNPPNVWKRCKMCGTLKQQTRRAAVDEKDNDAPPVDTHVGQIIEAQWTDMHYYEARVLKIAGSVVTVAFSQFPESGDCDVDISQIRPCNTVTQTEGSESLTAWDGAVNVLSVCAAALDTQEVIDRLQAGVAALDATAAPENLALTVQELMLSHLKNDTRTFRLFQGIHQNILVPAILALQNKLYSVLQKEGFLAASGSGPCLMQDVRSEDGWLVEITVGTETTTVKHIRMEQNCPDFYPTHFTVKWCLTMTFDKNISRLCGSSVRLEGLQLHPQFAADSKRRLQELVQVGMLIA